MRMTNMRLFVWVVCLGWLSVGCSAAVGQEKTASEQAPPFDAGDVERTEVAGEKGERIEPIPEKLVWQKKPPLLSACISSKDCKDILAMGHRGVIRTAPENTLEAIKEAYRLGADLAEIDVRLSKDGVPILLHDADVDRVAKGSGKSGEMTLKQLQSLTLKCPAQAKCSGKERITTLEDAVAWSQGKILLNLDMKTSQFEPVLAVLRRLKAEDNVLLFLSSDSEYAAYKKYGKGFVMMPRARNGDDARKLVTSWKQPLLHLDPKLYLTKELQGYLAKQGVKIMLNALVIYDIPAAQNVDAYGPLVTDFRAQIIQTDRLDLLVPYLKKLNEKR